MTSPESPRPQRGSTGRVVIWLIAGIVLLIGLYLFFRFARETPAVMHGMLS